MFLGIFANFLFNTFSIRGVAWIGGCIYFVGSLLTPHATSFNQLIVVYSIFEGKCNFLVPMPIYIYYMIFFKVLAIALY